MALPIVWNNIAATAEQASLLTPRNLRVSLIEAFAQTIPSDPNTVPLITIVTWDPDTNLISCDNNPYSNSVLNCIAVDAAYDQSNRLNVAWISNGNVYLNWFDTNAGNWTTSNFGTASQLTLMMSDPRTGSVAISTILLFYVRSGVVYYRAQLDRFQIEYTGMPVPVGSELINVGLSKNLRLQITLSGLYYKPGTESLGLQVGTPSTVLQTPRNISRVPLSAVAVHYSSGLTYTASYENGDIVVRNSSATIVHTVEAINLRRLDFAYDARDHLFVVWETYLGELFIHAWNDTWLSMETRSIGAGYRPCCHIDSLSPGSANTAGIMLFYQKGSTVVSRHQSDRYGFEYTVPNTVLTDRQFLDSCGMNSVGELILRIGAY